LVGFNTIYGALYSPKIDRHEIIWMPVKTPIE